MRTYNYIVSLGGNCRVAHNCRRHFGCRDAYPFDWWITPLSSTVAFLRDPDVFKLYSAENLAPYGAGGRRDSVVNTHFGIRLHYEFPRRGGQVVENFVELCERPASRTAYLLARFDRLCSLPGRILFVRNAVHGEHRNANKWHVDGGEMLALLDRKFGSRFDIMFINTPLRSSSDDRVFFFCF